MECKHGIEPTTLSVTVRESGMKIRKIRTNCDACDLEFEQLAEEFENMNPEDWDFEN